MFEVGFQAALSTTNKLFRTKLATPSASNPLSPHARPQVGGGAGAPGLPKGKTKRGGGTRRGLLDDEARMVGTKAHFGWWSGMVPEPIPRRHRNFADTYQQKVLADT